MTASFRCLTGAEGRYEIFFRTQRLYTAKAGIEIKAPGGSYDSEKTGYMNLEVSVGV